MLVPAMTKNFPAKFWSFSFYLLFYAGAVAIYNYFALYFQQEGIPGVQIGVLMGSSSLIGIFAGPLWSGLADARHRHRLILTTAIIGNVIAILLFPVFHTFLPFLLLMIVQSMFGGPIISMVDNATMSMLGDEKERYGSVRGGGTIGWGVAAPIVGAIVARYGLRWNFSIYAVLLLIGLVAIQQMHFGQRTFRVSIFGGLRELLTDRKWIVFLTIVFIAGNGSGIITNYLFVYLQKIGTSPAWMGWALTISTVAEFPALLVAHRLLKKLGSNGLLTLGLAVTALRCGLYGLVTVPWLALVVQLMQFFTYPILLVAGVSFAEENAPAGMGATAQSIFSGSFLGFGFAAGGFLGGVLIQYIGVQQMFLVYGIVILLAALIFGIAQYMQPASRLKKMFNKQNPGS
jgi:PPP family 3-phenylpropionic acid transporter